MQGHLEKRYKGSWTIVIETGFNPVTNKRERIVKSVKCTKAEATKIMNEMIYQLQTGTYIKPSNLTVADYLRRWLETYCELNLSPKSLQSYRFEIEKHIAPQLGQLTLEQLSPLHLQEYYNQKLKNGRLDGKGGLSARTVYYHHRIIHEALKHAMQWQLISKNPADAVVPPRFKNKEMNVLSKSEVNEFLKTIDKHRDYLLIYTAIFTGMRQGELLGMRWSEVDLKQHVIHVRQQMQYIKGEGYIFREPKTQKSKRDIPITPDLAEYLHKLKKQQNKERFSFGPEYRDLDLVFCLDNGGPLDPKNLTSRFKKLIKEFGRPELRFHDLRHTCATLFLEAGVDPKRVQEILGHESIVTTLDTYTHALPNMKREAVDQLSAFMRE